MFVELIPNLSRRNRSGNKLFLHFVSQCPFSSRWSTVLLMDHRFSFLLLNGGEGRYLYAPFREHRTCTPLSGTAKFPEPARHSSLSGTIGSGLVYGKETRNSIYGADSDVLYSEYQDKE